MLVDLGKRDVTDEQVKGMLAEVDKNKDSVIQWDEFIEVNIYLVQRCRCSSNLKSRIKKDSAKSSQSRLGIYLIH